MACIADLIPAFSPEQACRGLAAAIMSSLITPIFSFSIAYKKTNAGCPRVHSMILEVHSVM